MAPGQDFLEVAPGEDFLKVAPGRDFLSVAPGQDFLKVAPGQDFLSVAPGQDFLKVAPEQDFLKVAPGQDFLLQIHPFSRQYHSNNAPNNSGTYIPLARSPWKLNFGWWRLMFVLPPQGTSITSPLLLEPLDGSQLFCKICAPFP